MLEYQIYQQLRHPAKVTSPHVFPAPAPFLKIIQNANQLDSRALPYCPARRYRKRYDRIYIRDIGAGNNIDCMQNAAPKSRHLLGQISPTTANRGVPSLPRAKTFGVFISLTSAFSRSSSRQASTSVSLYLSLLVQNAACRSPMRLGY